MTNIMELDEVIKKVEETIDRIIENGRTISNIEENGRRGERAAAYWREKQAFYSAILKYLKDLRNWTTEIQKQRGNYDEEGNRIANWIPTWSGKGPDWHEVHPGLECFKCLDCGYEIFACPDALPGTCPKCRQKGRN